MQEIIQQALQQGTHLMVAVLYALGTLLKRIPQVPDYLIPVILAGAGAVLGYFYEGGIQGIMQGFTAGAAAVTSNQIVKQLQKAKQEKQPEDN